MTREEAINTLGNFKRYISGGGVTDLKANEAIDMAIEALSAEAVQGWIPVSERLPSESGRYLVAYPLFTGKDNWLNIMNFGKPSMPNIKVKGKCWYMSDDEYGDVVYDDILAWMPLPEPYRGGENE